MSALRLEMTVSLSKNGKVVHSAKRFMKTRLTRFVQEQKNSEWTSGKLTVWYSRANDYWNAGTFNTIAEFEQLLAEFTERPLVESFV